jgi:glycosyltransferase involved in cell wall biosynthesis
MMPPEGPGPFVSVITPFYNEERYLAQCIESVLGQSHSNFEYILVDNQSTDESCTIAHAYAARDKRIRVVRTPRFLTALQNQNFALTQVDPACAYCKIVLGDDWLYPHCLESMVAVGESDADVAVVGACFVWEDTVAAKGLDTRRTVFPGKEVCRKYFLDNVFPFGSPSTVMYRGSIVRARTPFFTDTNMHADTEAVFRVLEQHKFGFIHEVSCFVRMQPGSATHTDRDFYPEALDRLVIVRTFGALYLDEAEYDRVLQYSLRTFYRGLARQWLADCLGAKRVGFWEYQVRGLRTIGETIHPTLLVKHLIGGILETPARVPDALKAYKDLRRLNRSARKT